MTNRLDRLGAAGWIERQSDPADGRGVQVRLPASGRKVADRTFEQRLVNATDLLAPLPAGDRRALANLLRELLLPLSIRTPGML